MKRTGIVITILVLVTISCVNKQEVIITGIYPGDRSEYLYVNKLNLNVPVFIDSTKINKQGNFKLKIDIDEPGFYTLGFSNVEFVTILAEPGNRINIEFKGQRLQNDYTVTGSEESEKVRILDNKLGRTIIALDSLSNVYQEAIDEGNNDQAEAVAEEYTNILNEQRKYNIGFILDNLGNLSAIKALYQKVNENTFVLYRQRDLQYLKLVADSLAKYYPGNYLTLTLQENLEEELNQMYVNEITRAAEQSTPVTLDANLKDMDGNRVKLSNLFGKNYVLLSFWSAESKECIANNLFLKQMYQLYHRQGFEIYQVNIDSDEELWKRSVRFDELPWISVREDDPSSPVTAIKYNVSSIPANYLFDKNGDIIGKNLFGRPLKIKLGQIFD